MTEQELKKTPIGTKVIWTRAEDYGSHGVVSKAGVNFRQINWEDGQVTVQTDDWALKHVEVAV